MTTVRLCRFAIIALSLFAAPARAQQATTFIHDLQGKGAATTAPPDLRVTIEGIVTGAYQGQSQFQSFFVQEMDGDLDGDHLASEAIAIFCDTCPVAVKEGQHVRVTGVVSERGGMTTMTSTGAADVSIVDRGNQLIDVAPLPIALPFDEPASLERFEGMLVTFTEPLTIADLSNLGRYGTLELFGSGRPYHFTERSEPSAIGYRAHLADLARRRVLLDDDSNLQNAAMAAPEGQQRIYHPHAAGGLSNGAHGRDFVRTGDVVAKLTGILEWSAGGGRTESWRIRPTQTFPITFAVANPRPSRAPQLRGAVRIASANLLNYFSTIDETPGQEPGPCGPERKLDCRGADSILELDRQRERASLVVCRLDADVVAFMELENNPIAMKDLLAAINGRCGAKHPYLPVDAGQTAGTDAIRVAMIYRADVVTPRGAAHIDVDPIHDRPPVAQSFEVTSRNNPAVRERFTVVANHFKSKGCDSKAAPTEADQGDGQSCFAARRTAQAGRLVSWLDQSVVPATGDPRILLVGDFNSYAKETPIATLVAAGYTDLESEILGPSSYSYVYGGQLGHLDYALANRSLRPVVRGVGVWHINADETSLFDYDDDVRTVGEDAFEEKPNGSSLTPPRMLYLSSSPYRASDHDPVLVGLFDDRPSICARIRNWFRRP